jgi:hypothetical protein
MNNYEKAADEMLAAGRAASEPDRSGAHILALAAEHDVITADELPEVLASIREARNGPASDLVPAWIAALPALNPDGSPRLIGWPDEAAAIRASTIARPYAFQLADGSYAAAHAVEGDDPQPWVTGRGGAALLPDGRIVRLDPSETGLTWKVRSEPSQPLTETDAAEWRRRAGERADAIARLEGEVAGWRAEYAKVAEAIEAHLPYIESDGQGVQVARIANAGAVIDATARDRDEWRRKARDLEPAGEACAELETALAIKRTEADEPIDERLWRVYTLVMVQRTEVRKMERSRNHWRTKAKRLSEGARRGVVGSGTEARRAARKGDVAGAGRRTGKQRAKGERKGRR